MTGTDVLVVWGLGALLGALVGWWRGSVPMGIVFTLIFGPIFGLLIVLAATRGRKREAATR